GFAPTCHYSFPRVLGHILHRAADQRAGEAWCRAGDGAAAVQAEGADCDLLGRAFNGHGRPHFSSVVPREKVLYRDLVGSSGERLSCLSPCRVAQHLRFSRIGSTSPSDASPAFALQMIWKTPGKLPRVSSTETDPRESWTVMGQEPA